MSADPSSTVEPAPADPTATIAPEQTPEEKRAAADKLVAEGKKAIALKQWEEGVSKYADALDLMRELVGDFDPAMAPLLLSYGKALYELAFSQQGVMGKEKEQQAQDDEAVRQAVLSADQASSSNIVFSHEEADETDEPNVEGAAADEPEAAGGAAAADGGDEDADEPEDDYNAAWEVLDVARTIYGKMVEGEGDGDKLREEKLCLAECYLALGDVSCETENFPQAVQDYTSSLALKSALLPASSRALASVHYQLATVLEFTPNQRASALSHVESALSIFRARLSQLSSSSSSSSSLTSTSTEEDSDIKKMSDKEREKEKEDTEALIGDLEAKIEELKERPEQAEDLVGESIQHLLGEGSSGGVAGLAAKEDEGKPVNDLSGMVKRKKKPAPAPAAAAHGSGAANGSAGAEVGGEKRPADEGDEPSAKKARTE